MKPKVTKAQIRRELENQIQAFIAEGGSVNNIPRGQSGYGDNQNPFSQQGGSAPSQPRTSLDKELQELELRKRKLGNKPANPKNKKGPYKKLIKDDFGEPLRWVWIDND